MRLCGTDPFTRITLLSIFAVLCSSCHQNFDSRQWGEAHNGLRIHIDTVFQAKQGPKIILFFQNSSEKPLQFYQSWFWLNTAIQCLTIETGENAKPTPEGKHLLDLLSPGGVRSRNVLVTLSPGQVYEGESVELQNVYHLAKGLSYRVKCVYTEALAGGWSGAITSNISSFRVN